MDRSPRKRAINNGREMLLLGGTIVSVARVAGSNSRLTEFLGFRSLRSLHPRLNSATRSAGC
jgi:hypothetical protein